MPGWVGWDGMGREGMSWDGSGVGARYAMWKKLEKSFFYQQITPRHHCGALFASAGQLVAPSGLLFELLFVSGKVLGSSGAKAPTKMRKLMKHGSRKGRLFRLFVTWRTVKVMLFFGPFFSTIIDGFWVTLGKPNVVKV